MSQLLKSDQEVKEKKGTIPAAVTAHAKARQSQIVKVSEHCKSLRTGEDNDSLRCYILEDPTSWNSRVLGSY